MIVKKHILKTLNTLEKKYDSAMVGRDPQDSIFFSKLAVIEYCGWIEDALDKIIHRSVKGRLKSNEFNQILKHSVVENNYGFDYKKNFRPMLIKATGLVNAEKIETYLKKERQFDLFVSELEAIKESRNNAAHTFIESL